MLEPSPAGALVDATVARAATGDERAIATIWRALHPQLLRYLRSLGIEESQDVASTTWLELARALPALEPATVEALRRLLFTIARRRMVDEIRRRRHRPDPVALDWDLGEGVHEDRGVRAALEHLARLPPAQAEVIALRVVVGLSAEEVGELTGRTAGAVRVMAHRGLASLRAQLAAELTTMGPADQFSVERVTKERSSTIEGVQ